MTNCTLCPRKCGINRDKLAGYCGVTNKIKVARAGLHYWEEPIVSGKKGSGTIFFSGCNLKCVYCQNSEISHGAFGKEITPHRLAEIFKELEEKGANNINLVTPSHYVDGIIEALKIYKPKVPVVYNTSGYDSVETLKKLNGYVQVYLTDLKYYSSDLSNKYSKAQDYFTVVTNAIIEMLKQQPKNIIKNGLIKQGVIIRHMVLPGNSGDSVKVLEWIKENCPNVIVSIMGQYTPCYKASEYPEINKTITPLEYKRVIAKFNALGLKHGYCQDLDSADECYIPPFNLEGV